MRSPVTKNWETDLIMKYSTGSTDTQETCEVFKDIIIILSISGICIHVIHHFLPILMHAY